MNEPLNVLSVQSHVAYGHVGNSSAVFTMQRLGVEVWPVHTVQFSNHTGYGQWRGRVYDSESVAELIAGIADRGVLDQCDGVLSGYLGSADIGHAVLGAVSTVKAANPDMVYCCDPVLGDVGVGVFVAAGLPEFLTEHALPAADLITPNHFELDLLCGRATRTLDEVTGAVSELHARGPRVVMVTSLVTDDTPSNAVDVLSAQGGRFFRVRTPKLDVAMTGAGDAVAALFFVHWLRTRDVAAALRAAASAVHGLLARTQEAGSPELALVTAQDELVSPSQLFDVEEL